MTPCLVAGCRIEISGAGQFAMVVMKATSRVPGLDYCAPSLYVDGVLDPSDDYDRWLAEDLLGIEVYPAKRCGPADSPTGTGAEVSRSGCARARG
ncbi:MAG: hypothetical protein IPK85_15215 [Gemmatimonadetes bacterium]|nr:hypothetical protein [Gemmatimonadota bacterium]